MNDRKKQELLKVEMKRLMLKEERRAPQPARMNMHLLGRRRAFAGNSLPLQYVAH